MAFLFPPFALLYPGDLINSEFFSRILISATSNSLASSKSLFGDEGFSLRGWTVQWVSTHWARATKSKRTNSQSIPFVLFYIQFYFWDVFHLLIMCSTQCLVSSPDWVHCVVFSTKTVCQAMQVTSDGQTSYQEGSSNIPGRLIPKRKK